LSTKNAKKSFDYRGHRPGWRPSGRIAAGQGYEVHGVKRRSSSFNSERIDHLYQDPHKSVPASSCIMAISDPGSGFVQETSRSEIAIMQEEAGTGLVRVLIEMVDAFAVEDEERRLTPCTS